MRFSLNNSATGFVLSTFIAFSFFHVVVYADLKYYLYIEEENVSEETTITDELDRGEGTAAGEFIVLEAVGSLPFERSSYSVDGESCPSMVSKAGGINPLYICVGSHDQQKENVVFFPIAPTPDYDSDIASRLPLRFGALTESRGISSGLLLWRNAIAVDWVVPTATVNEANLSLDAISFGIDNSSDQFNTEWLRSTSSGYHDGEVLAEWHLLSEIGGEPILDDGIIQLIKGKPPISPQQPDLLDDGNEPIAIVNTLTDSSQNSLPPKATTVYCQSIGETLCDDKNNEKFGSMCSLLMQVGLDYLLSSPSSGSLYTIYAPTNEAFLRAFGGKTRPALLSGHDLTKFLLNHIIITVTSESSGESVFRYEDMVCGTKRIMASHQATKIGCDTNAEISYVIGAGNDNLNKPKFLAVDHETCNGVIHTIDYVILPSSFDNDDESMEQNHNHYFVNIDPEVELDEQQTPTITNNLKESDVISFFQFDTRDFEGIVDENEIMQTDTTTITTNEEGAAFDQNALRPVRQKAKNPLLQSQSESEEESPDESNLGNRRRRATASIPLVTSATEKSKQWHLRRPHQ
mmetsp:Transcript_34055/g.80154  ORF Transcript_34055/g.80154 Transcript_34055/m.80154 type:complete len:576 (-) Transcript_34055:1133-2860(-)